MYSFIRDIREDLLGLLYPEGVKCCLCGDEIWEGHRHGICNSCISGIEFIRDRYCSRCGKLLEKGDICRDCRSFFHYFDRAYSLCVYEGKVKEWIYAFKYGNRPVIARSFGKMMADRVKQLGIRDVFDCIVPVPLHRKKLRQRGYNQAALLGRVLAVELNKKFLSSTLLRVEDTPPLSGLTRHRRTEVLEKAFEINNCFPEGIKNVLLIDDIYTTGATVSQCAKILKKYGAKRVYVFTFASGRSVD